jgi:hypothetical protein
LLSWGSAFALDTLAVHAAKIRMLTANPPLWARHAWLPLGLTALGLGAWLRADGLARRRRRRAGRGPGATAAAFADRRRGAGGAVRGSALSLDRGLRAAGRQSCGVIRLCDPCLANTSPPSP